MEMSSVLATYPLEADWLFILPRSPEHAAWHGMPRSSAQFDFRLTASVELAAWIWYYFFAAAFA